MRCVLVGCGRIARKHAEIISSQTYDLFSLVAVCDIKKERASSFGDEYNVPFFTDMHEMMLSVGDNVDMVCVLTESGSHAEIVIELSKYGKHILVEKPMALRLEDASNMISACDSAGCRLFVVKQNRFNLPVLKMREALEHGRFGKLVMGTVRVRWCRTQEYYDMDAWRGTWMHDGGVLANQASHHIDLLEWMMGEVDSVFAKSRTALVDIETEDTAVVVLKFKNGAIGIVEATTATRPKDLEGSISILGETGTVEIGGFAVNELKTWNFEDSMSDDIDVYEKYSTNPPNVYGFGHKAYYEHIYDCIENDKQHLVDGEEGKKSLKLISAIYQSIESGKEVFLKDVFGNCMLGRS